METAELVLVVARAVSHCILKLFDVLYFLIFISPLEIIDSSIHLFFFFFRAVTQIRG